MLDVCLMVWRGISKAHAKFVLRNEPWAMSHEPSGLHQAPSWPDGDLAIHPIPSNVVLNTIQVLQYH